mmetsp:Transcript_114368/g.209408  ORF Transcript_114368/g.209408 Transcript_114368/m.209408 type:complete len:643 (-) Transcript_114368:127-2055(-)
MSVKVEENSLAPSSGSSAMGWFQMCDPRPISETHYSHEGQEAGMVSRIGRDVSFLWSLAKVKKNMEGHLAHNYTAADFFADAVTKHGDKLALVLVGSEKRYTYKDMDLESNRYAAWGIAQSLKQGDTVAVSSHNCPELIMFMLGMAKIGVCTSLLNPSISGKPLEHAVLLSKAQLVIGTAETLPTLLPLGSTYSFWLLGAKRNTQVLQGVHLLVSGDYKDEAVDPSIRAGMSSTAPLLHIFTSGTTGLPKAAKIHHLKFWGSGLGAQNFFGLRSDDRIYCCLPLYHSSAMLLGVAASWALGAPLILRTKFSASNFWKDCAEYKATCAQYIGELLRYLVNSPISDFDRNHKVRLVYGNGLRRDVWTKFVDRFAVPNVTEFYASTEGNATLINAQNKIGAVGFVSPLIEAKYPVALVKFDVKSETVVRDLDGRCVRCVPGEAGELLGLIKMDDPTRRFDGYTDAKATEKKILTDVFTEGDAWFRTGDLLRTDAEGFMYFVDRIGDTFRWKGENVSTAEVAEVLSTVGAIEEANVYGVQVGNNEGRCGMASIVAGERWAGEATLKEIYAATEENLPSYARPLFLRVQPQLEMTTTFKQKKVELVEHGFDPSVVKDPLFYRSASARQFIPMTQELYTKLTTGQERV